jgi:hypothetical protein
MLTTFSYLNLAQKIGLLSLTNPKQLSSIFFNIGEKLAALLMF